MTLIKIKNELSKEEHDRATASGADGTVLEMTPSLFIITGLEIEETQCVSADPWLPILIPYT
jgi:hypothetical protein